MKKIIIGVISSIIVLIIVLVVLYFTGESFLLKDLPLSPSEKKVLKENFNKEEIEYLIENQCDQFMTTIVNESDFLKKNMKEYCKYKNNNQEADEDTIYLVNADLSHISYNENVKKIIHSENVKIDNIERYITFLEKNPTVEIDHVITLVNKDYDKVVNQNEISMQLFLQNYFISDNLTRYLNYYEKHTDFSADNIVALVNSNRDYEYYTNVTIADLEKNEKILVNKYYRLSEDYTPDLVILNEDYTIRSSRVTKETSTAFIEMAKEAEKNNLTLLCQSAYRSYDSQNYVYNDYLRSNGSEWTNLHEAKPGFSEYQTGLSLDIINGKNENIEDFQNTREYQWLIDNAYKYGFILRYPEGKESITGFAYTPYHFRYVGKNIAKIIWKEAITLEEYFAYYEK